MTSVLHTGGNTPARRMNYQPGHSMCQAHMNVLRWFCLNFYVVSTTCRRVTGKKYIMITLGLPSLQTVKEVHTCPTQEINTLLKHGNPPKATTNSLHPRSNLERAPLRHNEMPIFRLGHLNAKDLVHIRRDERQGVLLA